MLKHVPDVIDYDATYKLVADDMNPLNVVLLQEVDTRRSLDLLLDNSVMRPCLCPHKLIERSPNAFDWNWQSSKYLPTVSLVLIISPHIVANFSVIHLDSIHYECACTC